jgi:hypothetical protein
MLVAVCRKAIVAARMRLATDRTLTEEQRANLWGVIDARDWFIQFIAKDYEAEIAAIERDLATQLD